MCGVVMSRKMCGYLAQTWDMAPRWPLLASSLPSYLARLRLFMGRGSVVVAGGAGQWERRRPYRICLLGFET